MPYVYRDMSIATVLNIFFSFSWDNLLENYIYLANFATTSFKLLDTFRHLSFHCRSEDYVNIWAEYIVFML